MTFDRCRMSRTSTSTSVSKISCWRLMILRLLIAPSCFAIALVSSASAPGSFAAMTLIRPVCLSPPPCRRGAVVVPLDVDEPLRRGGEALEVWQSRGVDRDPLAGRDDADDPVARQRMAAAGVVDRHARHQPGDRHPGRSRRPSAARRRARLKRRAPSRGARRLCRSSGIGRVHHVLAGRDCRCRPRRRDRPGWLPSAPSAPLPAPSPNRPAPPGGTPWRAPRGRCRCASARCC